MFGRYDLHLRDKASPVGLLGEIDLHVLPIGTEGHHCSNTTVVHGPPFVLGCGHAGLHAHPVPHFDDTTLGCKQNKQMLNDKPRLTGWFIS